MKLFGFASHRFRRVTGSSDVWARREGLRSDMELLIGLLRREPMGARMDLCLPGGLARLKSAQVKSPGPEVWSSTCGSHADDAIIYRRVKHFEHKPSKRL